ncbi:MAG: hypothetical protein ACE5G8_09215 [Anaerolineae bacterium]
MKQQHSKQAWRATVVFYVVLLLVITILDWANQVLQLGYWGIQVGLITIGIILLWLVGRRFPDLSAQRGVFLAFSIGVLTIIPGVLMALKPGQDFWGQYFSIGLSMAAGSFLGFLFIKFAGKLS